MDSYDFPFSYRAVGFNAHRSAAGALVAGPTEIDTYRVTSFDYSRLQQRDQREALHLLSGGDLGDATLAFRYISLAGMIRASNGSRLDDMIAALFQAFDVEEAQRENPTTEGVTNFDFTGTTEINNGRGTAFTDEHGVAGQFFVPERFLARPAAYPIITARRSSGNSAGFAVELVCPDRRRFCQTAEAVVLNAGNAYVANAPNWNAGHGISVSPLLTIVMAGAGSATLTITIAGSPVGPLILNMAAESAGTFTVDCSTGLIKKGATHRQDLRASSVTTPYMAIVPGGGNISSANNANVTSITAAYRQARG